ncbi:hypothetical protein C9417_25990 [Rhizobium sp. SEMIA 4088]|nr:hypothetical protein C9417_25990 [Rhizobium sp. SEMIA 4088]
MQRARPIEHNEEYRRNQHSGRPTGGISGILVVRGAGNSAAAGASTWWPEGEAGPTAPRLRTPSCRPDFRSGRKRR